MNKIQDFVEFMTDASITTNAERTNTTNLRNMFRNFKEEIMGLGWYCNETSTEEEWKDFEIGKDLPNAGKVVFFQLKFKWKEILFLSCSVIDSIIIETGVGIVARAMVNASDSMVRLRPINVKPLVNLSKESLKAVEERYPSIKIIGGK